MVSAAGGSYRTTAAKTGQSAPGPFQTQWLIDHLNAVADLAAGRGETFGVACAARFVGCLHDLGKYSEAFQLSIQNNATRPDHSTAGAQIWVDLGKSGATADRLIVEILAYG